MHEHRKNITLIFRRKQLYYDIANVCFVTGDVLPTDDDHARHQIWDVVEDGNKDRVARMLDLAFAQIRYVLSAYIRYSVHEGDTATDILCDKHDYILDLSVPDSFLSTAHSYLEQLIHNWLVATVVHDWLSFVHPDKNECNIWQMKADSLLAKVATALTGRTRRARVRKHPFP